MVGDESTTMDFPDVKIMDGQWHTFVLHLHNLQEQTNKVDLYVDCNVIGKQQTIIEGRLGKTFNKKALNLAQMRVGQSGLITSPKPLLVSPFFAYFTLQCVMLEAKLIAHS